MLFNDKDIKSMVENFKKSLRREMDALNHDIRGLVRKMNSTQIDQNAINEKLAKSIDAGAEATLELANTVEEMAKKIHFLEDRLLTLEMKRFFDHEPIVNTESKPEENIAVETVTIVSDVNVDAIADILDGPDTIQE